jgi:hypothetical protein
MLVALKAAILTFTVVAGVGTTLMLGAAGRRKGKEYGSSYD